jgi:hypothetical protein
MLDDFQDSHGIQSLEGRGDHLIRIAFTHPVVFL